MTTQSLSDELNVLKSIYAGDFTTIPLEIGYCKSIKMHLYPEEESSPENFYLELILHIPKQYPEQIPKLEAGEYKGITREQVKELLDQIFDLSLKLSGHNMLLDLIASCKEILNKFYAKYIHSLNTQEDLYEKFQMNQKIREEEEKRLKAAKLKEEKIGGENIQEKELGRIMFMNEVEESKLREKWFSAREEDRKNVDRKNDARDSDDSDRVDEYSAGCELIPLKDLLIIQLLKVVSTLSSKLLGSDENSFRNMLYAEVKSMDIMNEDALELLKKRANTIFNKLYREKIRLQTRKQKKKQHNNVAIEDLLFKPVLSATDNQFFKLIETVKKSNGAETQQQHQRNDSIEIIYDKEGDLPDSMADTEEKEEDRKEEQSSSMNLPVLIERTSSIDTTNLTKGASKSPLPVLGHTTSHKFTSRYQEDFEEMEFLGRGASSEVVKVRNKLDGRFYAIKKIMIKQGQRLTRIMREVQTLSRLHHQNIIRYYQAWLEEVPDSERIDLSLEDLDEEEENDPDTDSKSFDLSGGFSSTYTESFNDNPDRLMLQFSEKKILCLCIQTEYCQQALRATLIDPQLDANTIWRLFRQILEALAYIHTQKVIHRDLKPENIFMGIGGDIKIGDFGLATKHQTQLHSSEKNKINNLLNLKKSQMTEKEFSELDKTMNVGTYFYRAYEVDRKETTTYDEKVDVYSLGIILFEMWHPFTSRYERYKILFDLKNKRKLPPKFEEAHPRQSRLIKWMLERDPTQRPTVVEILNNDLLPPKMEDDYMNDVIKSVSNPNTIFYKKLIEALFQNKGPGSSYNHVLCTQSLWEATYNHSQEIFVNLVSQRMSNHLRYMGALPITTPILNPLDPGSSGTRAVEGYGLFENDPRVSFVNKLGYLEYLRINPRKEFEQYLQNLNPKFLATNFFKSFDITDVYSSRVNEGIIKQTVLNYDSLITLSDYYNTNAAETILLNLISLDRQFAALSSSNSQSANNLLKIKFTHMALVKMLFQTMKISNKGKIIQILRLMYGVIQNDLSLAQAKVKIQQVVTISDKEFDRLITFFTLNGTLEQCKRTFESLLPNHEKLNEILKKLENVFNEIKDLFNTYKDLMKEKQKNLSSLPDFELDMSILDPELLFKKDIYYEIRYRDLKLNRYELLSFGGVYRVKLDKVEGLHKQEVGHEPGKSRNLAEHSNHIHVGAKNKLKKKEVCGFTIYLEKLSRIIYGNLMRAFQTEKSNKIAANVFFKYEVMICSLGADPAATKVKLSMICWQLKIPNLLYITGDPNTSLEEQLECAEKNDINLVIIIKEKIYQSKQKITLRWKKEKNKVEKECTMEELIAFLSKSFKGGSSAPSLS